MMCPSSKNGIKQLGKVQAGGLAQPVMLGALWAVSRGVRSRQGGHWAAAPLAPLPGRGQGAISEGGHVFSVSQGVNLTG